MELWNQDNLGPVSKQSIFMFLGQGEILALKWEAYSRSL